jgi:peptidyl-prolyl cis-trans isomerase SurA
VTSQLVVVRRVIPQYAARMLKSITTLALGLAASGFVTSCRSTSATGPAAVSADTWAVVNGKTISRQDVDKAFRRAQNPAQPISDEEALTAKLNVLDDLVTQQLLLGKAAQLKLDVAPAELDTAFNDTKKNIPDDAFQQELTRRGITAPELRDGLRSELLARKVITQEVGAKAAVSEQDINEFFNANRAQFNIPEEAYHIAQLVVTPVREPQQTNRRGDDATTPEAATAKVQGLLERLKAGASFAELAADYSEDPESSQRGGDLGFVPVSRLRQAPPALRDAVINKPAGSVSVVSLNGAHTIVLVVAHESAGQRDLSNPEVREQITQTLRTRKEQLLRAAYLASLRNDAQVTNYLASRLVASNGKLPNLPLAAPGAK